MATVLTPPRRIAATRPYGPRDAGIPMTLDEFDAGEFEPGFRYEVIHGVLVVSPIPLPQERDANEQLGFWLRLYQEQHPQGAALDLTLPEHNIRTKTNNRRCDRAIWVGLGRIPNFEGPLKQRDTPRIVVEFPSARAADQRRDYEEKRVEYRDVGVDEYWIIDRFRRSMTVYSWRGRRWVKRVIDGTGTYHTPLLPGFVLSVRELLVIADRCRSGEDRE